MIKKVDWLGFHKNSVIISGTFSYDIDGIKYLIKEEAELYKLNDVIKQLYQLSIIYGKDELDKLLQKMGFWFWEKLDEIKPTSRREYYGFGPRIKKIEWKRARGSIKKSVELTKSLSFEGYYKYNGEKFLWHPYPDPPKDGMLVSFYFKIDGSKGTSSLELEMSVPSEYDNPPLRNEFTKIRRNYKVNRGEFSGIIFSGYGGGRLGLAYRADEISKESIEEVTGFILKLVEVFK